MKVWSRLSACAWLLLIAGCAVHKYRPAPVSTASSLDMFEAKSLDSPTLKSFLEAHSQAPMAAWPLRSWTLDNLILAAYYYSPDLDAARANVAAAEGAEVTAGARPNPTIGFGAGYETSPESPYLWNLDFTIPIETAHKRGYRMLQASELTEASRIALAQAGWQVRMKVRTALLEHLIALRDVEALRAEEVGHAKQVQLLEHRFQVGEIAKPEVNSAEIDLSNATLALHVAEGTVETTRSTLASAIGVPLTDLKNKQWVWPDFQNPPHMSTADVERDAGLNRLDLQQAIAEYKASDADLRLQIAKQYPDIQLGPHGDHQEGYNNVSLGVVLELPILNRNQGPIAEAEAKRKIAESHVRVLQSSAIAEADSATAEYDTAQKRVAEAAGRLQRIQAQLTRQAEQAVKRGEEDRSSIVSAEIQDAVAQRAVLDALHSEQSALGSLEEAVQRPFDTSSPLLTPDQSKPKPTKHGGTR